MTLEPTAETKNREAGHAPSKCLLKWSIDPATGKPVARWTVDQPERIPTFLLKTAA
jgi:hypothetical protein